jgi:CHAD domain-containing protein
MDVTALSLLTKTAKTRLRNLRAQAKLCRKQFSEEAVHDLRVAMRRLLALVDFLNFFAASPALRKVRRSLKSHLDAFDALRDTQVMLMGIRTATDAAAGDRAFPLLPAEDGEATAAPRPEGY